jgi:hypothetical protein
VGLTDNVHNLIKSAAVTPAMDTLATPQMQQIPQLDVKSYKVRHRVTAVRCLTDSSSGYFCGLTNMSNIVH